MKRPKRSFEQLVGNFAWVVASIIVLLAFFLAATCCYAENKEGPQTNAKVSAPSPTLPNRSATQISKLRVTTDASSVNIKILTDGQVINYNLVPEKDALVLEFPQLSFKEEKAEIPVESPLVQSIHASAVDSEGTRLQINLAKNVRYTLGSTNSGLVMNLVEVPAEEPGVIRSSKQKSVVKGIGFQTLPDGKSEIVTRLKGVPPVSVKKSGDRELTFAFDKTYLPERFTRFLDTSQFISAVDNVVPEKDPRVKNRTVLRVALRENVPYWLESQGDALAIKFAQSTVPPQKPITLSKPVTVVEGTSANVAQAPVKVAAAPPQPMAQPPAVMPTQNLTMAPETAPPSMELPGTEVLGVKKDYTGEPISLDLQGADLVNVLRLLADISGTNMIIEPGVSGKVTLKVEKVPWDQVLDVVLRMNGLGREQEGNIIRIAKLSKLRKEMEDIQKQIRAKQNVLETAQDLGEITQNYLQVNYASAGDIAAQIDKVKSSKGTISVDKRTNIIIYSDYPARVKRAREILAQLDRPTPQVLIEARIVQANSRFQRDLGINWSAGYDIEDGNPAFSWAVNLPAGAINTSAALSIGKLLNTTFWSLDMLLSANESQGNVKIISAPRVLTLDGVEATITQGTEIPYATVSQDGTKVEFKEAILELKVTPHITPDQKVRLEISAKKDQPGVEYNAGTAGTMVGIDTRKVETELLIDSGDTLVIGGIMENTENKSQGRTPGLSSIPILGLLFKNKSIRTEKQELLVFISPKVITQPYFTASGNTLP